MDYLYLQPRRRNKPLFYLTAATLLVLLMPLFHLAGSGGGREGVVAARPASADRQVPGAELPDNREAFLPEAARAPAPAKAVRSPASG